MLNLYLTTYGYDYGYETESVFFGLGLAFYIFYAILVIASIVLIIIALWRAFEKFGKPNWAAVVPGYNAWVLFELCEIPGWMIFIPFANVVFLYVAYYRLAKKYDKSINFSILTILYPQVMLPILTFGKKK